MNRKPSVYWIVFAGLMLVLSIVLQIPASWVLAKTMSDNTLLQHVSGSVWHGGADVVLTGAGGQQPVQGRVTWRFKPLPLLLLRLQSEFSFESQDSHVQGDVALGFGRIGLRDVNGQLTGSLLNAITPVQWANVPVKLQDVNVVYKRHKAFTKASGQIQWAGGALRYQPAGQSVQKVTLPALSAQLTINQQQMMVDVRARQQEKMAQLLLSPDWFLDIRLSQRLMQNVQGYEGQAAIDSTVVALRQPLSSLGLL